jgi:hypothetical protein
MVTVEVLADVSSGETHSFALRVTGEPHAKARRRTGTIVKPGFSFMVIQKLSVCKNEKNGEKSFFRIFNCLFWCSKGCQAFSRLQKNTYFCKYEKDCHPGPEPHNP